MATAAAEPPTELYTRGKPGEADNRGESLVAKHAERVQQEQQDQALQKLAALMPQMGAMVRELALQEAAWDVEAALALLRQFQVAHLDKLNIISKKRKKVQEAIDEEVAEQTAKEEGGRKDSSSGGSSSSDGSGDDTSSSDSEDNKKRKRSRSPSRSSKRSSKSSKRKGSSRSRERSKKRSSKDSKKRRRKEKEGSRDRDKKKRRKDKDSKREAERSGSDQDGELHGGRGRKALTHSSTYGKYGVLRESDAAAKRPEFMAWALDVKKADVESLARWEERDLFKEFMEEFNTGSLPHRKYYDLDAYARQKRAKEMAKAAERAGKGGAGFDAAADEESLKRERAAQRAREQQERLAVAYKEIKGGDKARDMRAQELLRAEMALAYKTGDYAKANKLKERLAPDDEKKK